MSIDPQRWTQKTNEVINEALQDAKSANNPELTPEHVLQVLLKQTDGIVLPVIQRSGASAEAIENIKQKNEEALKKLPQAQGGQTQTGKAFAKLISDADGFRTQLTDEYLSTEHLLLAMPKELVADRLGITQDALLVALSQVRGPHRVTSQNPEGQFQALEKYGQDLTELARQGKIDPVIGRDDEIRRVIQVLSRRTKNNPVLIGDPGVGKTAIVEGLARRIVEGDVPESLRNKRLISLDLASMVAGAKYRGEFEERLQAVLKEITSSNGEVITFLDELHTMVGAGSSGDGSMDAGNMLKPLLARGQLRLIGATTLDEYRTHIEKDAALERRFQQVFVNQPSVNDTIAILRGLKERYEVHHGVRIQDGALVAAAVLSDRYLTGRFLPDKAIDLVDEAASKLRIEIDSLPTEIDVIDRRIRQLEIERVALGKESDTASKERLLILEEELGNLQEQLHTQKARWQAEKELIDRIRSLKEELETVGIELERESDLERAAEIRYGIIPELERTIEEVTKELNERQGTHRILKEEVDDEDIAEVVGAWTGVPVARLLEGEVQKLVRLESLLHERVIGQEEAVSVVANAIRRSRAGIADPNRPIGSFLFLGPTGVGKTELAKSLAFFLFDNEQAMVRIDMSEYMEKHSVSRLIGAPPGYVGYGEGGQLTEAVRRRPYAVVLLDEVEKAHPEVFNVLLQLLDDGRITDGQGRTVDFTNVVLIMTSNLSGDPSSYFKAEFINRIDEIVRFESLQQHHLQDIVTIQMQSLQKRLASKRMTLTLTDDAKQFLVHEGYDPAFGARPLRRVIQKEIGDRLALGLLEGKFHEGDNLTIDTTEHGTICIQPTPCD